MLEKAFFLQPYFIPPEKRQTEQIAGQSAPFGPAILNGQAAVLPCRT